MEISCVESRNRDAWASNRFLYLCMYMVMYPLQHATIMSLIRHAYCPHRIEFWIYQEVQVQKQDIFSLCLSMCNNVQETSFIRRMHVVTQDTEMTNGSLFAWNELSKYCSADRGMILLTSPGLVAQKDWDFVLRQKWNAIYTLKIAQSKVLTCLPNPVMSTTGYSGASEPEQADGAMGMVQQWMRHATSSSAQQLEDSHYSTYITVQDAKGYFPQISHRAFPLPPSEPIETIACSTALMFMPLHVFRKMLQKIGHMQVADYALDWTVSTALWSEGVRFYVPGSSIPFRFQKQMNPRPAQWKSKALFKELLHIYGTDYADFVGVDMYKSSVYDGENGIITHSE